MIYAGIYIFSDVSVLNFFDPILMLVLAWFIHDKKSRTAAVMLGMYTVLIAISTLGNRIGVDLIGGFGGKNIVLAALAVYGIYKGLQGTFKYHELVENEVIWGNVWKMLGLSLLYNILGFGILILITYLPLTFPPGVEQCLWGYDESAFCDDVFGGVTMLSIFLASAGTAFRVLPWTKNKPLIAIKKVDAH